MRHLLLALLLVATPVSGQDLPPEPHLVAPVLSGLAWGSVGFLGGALAGGQLSQGCAEYLCELGGAALGALIGETVGMAIGVHIGNRRRGNAGLDLLTATGTGIAGVALLESQGDDSGVLFLTVVAVQLAGTVAVERGVGRARERKMAVSVRQVPEGEIRVGVSIPLP